MSGGHFTTDELRAFAKGEAGTDFGPLLEHLETCARCGDQLAVFLSLGPPVPSRSALRTPVMTLIGVVLVAVLAVAVQSRPAAPPSVEEQLVQLATHEPPPAMIVDIHVRMSQAVPVDLAGAPSIRAGGELLLEGDYAAAAASFEREMFAHPRSELVALYWGLARYLDGDDSLMVHDLLSFASESRNQTIKEFGNWYLANHLLRTGDTAGALEVLDRVRAEPTNPGKDSQALADRINELSAPR